MTMTESTMVIKRKAEVTENGGNFLEIDTTKRSKLQQDLKIVMNDAPDSSNKSAPRIERPKESSVLGKVKSFLPLINKANLDLKKQLSEGNHEKFDIENVKDSENVIEMDLSLVPSGCNDENLPAPVFELLNCAEESDSDSSAENQEEKNVSTKKDPANHPKNLIEEV